MSAHRTYGSYPHLFWDLDPSEPVNIRHAVVLRRVLQHGTTADIQQLIDPGAALASLAVLDLPDNILSFWRAVFERAAAPAA